MHKHLCFLTEDYAVMCNLARRGEDSDSLRERPGYEYGGEGPDDHFLTPYFDTYGNPAGPYDAPESVPLFNENDYSVNQPPVHVPIARPREMQPQPVSPYAGECKDRVEIQCGAVAASGSIWQMKHTWLTTLACPCLCIFTRLSD